MAGCTGCLACLQVCPDFCFEVFKFESPIELEVG
jgi:2-oxoglutarate ferredoxin oxidoreductase subunit delta